PHPSLSPGGEGERSRGCRVRPGHWGAHGTDLSPTATAHGTDLAPTATDVASGARAHGGAKGHHGGMTNADSNFTPDRSVPRLAGVLLAGGALGFIAVFSILAARLGYPGMLD